jgi:hypothetical protein
MEGAFDDSDEPISYVTGKFLSSRGQLGRDAMDFYSFADSVSKKFLMKFSHISYEA